MNINKSLPAFTCCSEERDKDIKAVHAPAHNTPV
jgi:hypothetical protein